MKMLTSLFTVFNLVNNIDVEATNEKMKKYSAENQQSIYINQSKQASEAVALSLRIVEDEKNFQVGYLLIVKEEISLFYRRYKGILFCLLSKRSS